MAIQYEASIIVLTYNCNYQKLEQTLLSIINQSDVMFEIIIADDGSKENYSASIVDLFCKESFSNYKLVLNAKNQGTIKNCMSGLEQAEGEYTKFISPGDYFAHSLILKGWIDFMRKSKVEWSFSDAVYYFMDDNKRKIVSVEAHPQLLNSYRKSNKQKSIWNYVVLDDIALGATMFARTTLQKKYLYRLIQKNVKYAEDNMFRLMMFDGICGEYYPVETIYYEYGSGVSSCENDKWKQILKRDWDITGQIMKESTQQNSFQKKMLRCMDRKEVFAYRFFVKGFINLAITRRMKTRMTGTGSI